MPKMSTPKLTAALKVSSNLQQRITDTLSARYTPLKVKFLTLSRLNQEQTVIGNVDSKTLGLPSIVGTQILSDDLIQDGSFISPNEAVSLDT